MFNYNFRNDLERRPCNPVRNLECILCLICLALAIYILLNTLRVHPVLRSILILVAAAFFFITLVDITVTCLLKPLFWSSWILFDLAAVLCFFLCTGILMFRISPFGVFMYTGALIANAITGLVFLVDLLYLFSLLFKEEDVDYIKKEPSLSQRTSKESTPPTTKANQATESDQQLTGRDRSVQCPSDAFLRRGKFTCRREICPKRYSPASEVSSHGGTFHVSRDVTPILNPNLVTPNRPISRTHTSDGSCGVYPRISFGPDSTTISNQRRQDEYGNLIEDSVTITSRSVATSARTVSKPSTERSPKTSMTNAITCNQHGDSINQANVDYQQPNSSPAPSTVQHYYSYPCARCGRIHQQIQTVQPVSNPESQRLPTLQENSYYITTEQPTKDYTDFSCPATQYNYNRLSPPSANSVNTYGSRASSNQRCSQFGSPYFGTSGSINNTIFSASNSPQGSAVCSLANNARSVSQNYNTVPCQPAQQTCYNTPARLSMVKDDGDVDIWDECCHTQPKQQTQPDAYEKKHDGLDPQGSCKCAVKRQLSASTQCSAKRDFNKPKVYNRGTDNCFCEGEEIDTVLPGAADCSPKNNICTERYVVRHPEQPQQQEPTAIDIKSDSNKVPVRYLEPTGCPCPGLQQQLQYQQRHPQQQQQQPQQQPQQQRQEPPPNAKQRNAKSRTNKNCSVM